MDVKEILKHGEKSLNEVAELFEVTPRDVLETIIKRDRTPTELAPAPQQVEPEKVTKAPQDLRPDEQLEGYFLNRLQKESLSVAALNNKYKVKDKERVERILEKLIREGKLTKRESRNKKGRYVYEVPKE